MDENAGAGRILKTKCSPTARCFVVRESAVRISRSLSESSNADARTNPGNALERRGRARDQCVPSRGACNGCAAYNRGIAGVINSENVGPRMVVPDNKRSAESVRADRNRGRVVLSLDSGLEGISFSRMAHHAN